MTRAASCPPDTRPLPDHGTITCYYRGCRNPECLTVGHRYDKAARIRRARGIPAVIDAAPAAQHIARMLAADGVTCASIADTAGVSPATVTCIANGTRTRILARTAAAILAVRVPDPDPADIVDATGTARRLRALAAIGYPGNDLAARIGGTKTFVSDICNDRRRRVRRATANRVEAVYRELAATLGPSDYTRAWAKRRGWPTPDQWDGEIDNAVADPHAWVRRRDDRRRTEDIVADAEELHAEHNLSWEAAAAQLGVPVNTLHTYRSRARRRDEARVGGDRK